MRRNAIVFSGGGSDGDKGQVGSDEEQVRQQRGIKEGNLKKFVGTTEWRGNHLLKHADLVFKYCRRISWYLACWTNRISVLSLNKLDRYFGS